VEHLIASEIGRFLHGSVSSVRFLRTIVINPSAEIRVAFSALLRIATADQYLLIRNLHRPETFGPFGGVYKYLDNAQPSLDKFEFKPQVVGPGLDMKNDLRGFLPRKNLAKLVAWYYRETSRESYKQCLVRELKEELKEADLGTSLRCPSDINFGLVRSIAEGPVTVPGQHYKQFRVFEVYDPSPKTNDTDDFLRHILKIVRRHRNLLLASSQEIASGRTRKGNVIGPHTGYLIGRKRTRPDDPAFSTRHPK
jgi:hypothetical protein